MELLDKQIEFIEKDLITRGICYRDLPESLIDHICCAIEEDLSQDFDTAYHRVIEAFGENGLQKIQDESIYYYTLKYNRTMKKAMYLMGYIAAFLSTTGVLFKIQR